MNAIPFTSNTGFMAQYVGYVREGYPGVKIGDNVLIGAGNVVTKDIHDWMLAAGNPCKVIRKIMQEDIQYYYKDRQIDGETAAALRQVGR